MKNKTYLLYSDEDKTELLSMLFSRAEAKEDSLNYEEGQWFSYEQSESDKTIMYGDTEKKVTFKFGNTIEKDERKKEKSSWIDGSIR